MVRSSQSIFILNKGSNLMNNKGKEKKQHRIQQIEDRKIEILLEIASINQKYDDQVSLLNSEYEKLHKELYVLQIEKISRGSFKIS